MIDSEKVVVVKIFYSAQVKSQGNSREKLFNTLEKPLGFLNFNFSFN